MSCIFVRSETFQTTLVYLTKYSLVPPVPCAPLILGRSLQWDFSDTNRRSSFPCSGKRSRNCRWVSRTGTYDRWRSAWMSRHPALFPCPVGKHQTTERWVNQFRISCVLNVLVVSVTCSWCTQVDCEFNVRFWTTVDTWVRRYGFEVVFVCNADNAVSARISLQCGGSLFIDDAARTPVVMSILTTKNRRRSLGR